MSYIKDAIDAIHAELPDCDPDLTRFYALLALTTGEATSLEDVHHAWGAWKYAIRPDHPAMIPFNELTADTQELDRKYAEAIQRVASKLADSTTTTGGTQ